MKELLFEDVRSDWYAANTLLPRLIAKALIENTKLKLDSLPNTVDSGLYSLRDCIRRAPAAGEISASFL